VKNEGEEKMFNDGIHMEEMTEMREYQELKEKGKYYEETRG
jgi:hypothetical protein